MSSIKTSNIGVLRYGLSTSVGLNYREAQLKDHVCHWAVKQSKRIMIISGGDQCPDKAFTVLTAATNSQRQDGYPIHHLAQVLRLTMPHTPGRYENV